jgi:hypothetical protein
MLQLELLDEKMASGTWTSFDARTQGGLNNTIRLCLKELGSKKRADPTPSLHEYLASTSEAESA